MRGLSQLQKCKKNYQMLNFLLKKLMPWASETYNFSYLEVNKFAFSPVYKYTFFMTTLLDAGACLLPVDLLEKFCRH